MNWHVNWLPDTTQELAAVWLNAPDRNAVTRAAHLIDVQLQNDPENTGQPYTNGRRTLLVVPLGVVYRVLRSIRRVEVIHVWWVQPSNGQPP